MKFDCEVILNDKVYKFNSIDDDPLTFEMKINDNWYLYRHINCDDDCEYMQLVHLYISVINGVSKAARFPRNVYEGKEIESEIFMKELLEHVLDGII